MNHNNKSTVPAATTTTSNQKTHIILLENVHVKRQKKIGVKKLLSEYNAEKHIIITHYRILRFSWVFAVCLSVYISWIFLINFTHNSMFVSLWSFELKRKFSLCRCLDFGSLSADLFKRRFFPSLWCVHFVLYVAWNIYNI